MQTSTQIHKSLPAPDTGVCVSDWRIQTQKSHILDSVELDRLKEELKLPGLPEMVFGSSFAQFLHIPSGFVLSFTASDALKAWDWTIPAEHTPKVKHHQQWTAGAQNDINKHNVSVKDFDWTFTTKYKGTLTNKNEPSRIPTVQATEERIPMDKLRRPDPILYFDELMLLEDELGDNGTAMLSIKLRVMPAAFFCLQQFFLRIDGVLYRTLDTRIYHEFGWNYLLRECQRRQGEWNSIRAVRMPSDPASVNNLALIYPLLEVKDLTTEKIPIF